MQFLKANVFPASAGAARTKASDSGDADQVYTLDLTADGRGIPEVIGIVIAITGTVDCDVQAGTTIATLAALTDVNGVELTNISASGVYWVDGSGCNFLRFTVDVTDAATFSYTLIH